MVFLETILDFFENIWDFLENIWFFWKTFGIFLENVWDFWKIFGFFWKNTNLESEPSHGMNQFSKIDCYASKHGPGRAGYNSKPTGVGFHF